MYCFFYFPIFLPALPLPRSLLQWFRPLWTQPTLRVWPILSLETFSRGWRRQQLQQREREGAGRRSLLERIEKNRYFFLKCLICLAYCIFDFGPTAMLSLKALEADIHLTHIWITFNFTTLESTLQMKRMVDDHLIAMTHPVNDRDTNNETISQLTDFKGEPTCINKNQYNNYSVLLSCRDSSSSWSPLKQSTVPSHHGRHRVRDGGGWQKVVTVGANLKKKERWKVKGL